MGAWGGGVLNSGWGVCMGCAWCDSLLEIYNFNIGAPT